MAVIDDPTAKAVAISRMGGAPSAGSRSRVHTPAHDEMGIALQHESITNRPNMKDAAKEPNGARKPTLDEMGPGPDREAKRYRAGPRSTTGRAGMRGGWKPRGR